MTNKDINYSDISPLTDAQLASMKPLSEVFPQAIHKKVDITIRLDKDTIQWFKEHVQQVNGDNYHNYINDALRDYIEQQKQSSKEASRQILREEHQKTRVHLLISILHKPLAELPPFVILYQMDSRQTDQ